MKWSFKIGRLLGIELRIHVTFFLIVAWAAYVWSINAENQTAGAIYGAFVILMLFICVVIHEMAHSKMAQHYGAEVSSITLLPIGGVSQLKSMPDDPKKELWVSVVGPMSNVVIAIFLALALILLPDKDPYPSITTIDFWEYVTGIALQPFITYMLIINIMLAVFNLLPAFPLDGGRVLRSILAMFMPSIQATRIAKTIGQVLAFALGMFGLFTGAFLLIIIAIFIFFGASQEGAGAEMKNILKRLDVQQALTTEQDFVSPNAHLSDAVQTALHSYQEDFPVLDSEGRLVGLLTRSNLLRGIHDLGLQTPVRDVMETEFPTIRSSDDFAKVFEKMNETQMKAIPVVDNGMFLGIMTLEHLSEVFQLLSVSNQQPMKG